jgi:hypothetical protein
MRKDKRLISLPSPTQSKQGGGDHVPTAFLLNPEP